MVRRLRIVRQRNVERTCSLVRVVIDEILTRYIQERSLQKLRESLGKLRESIQMTMMVRPRPEDTKWAPILIRRTRFERFFETLCINIHLHIIWLCICVLQVAIVDRFSSRFEQTFLSANPLDNFVDQNNQIVFTPV